MSLVAECLGNCFVKCCFNDNTWPKGIKVICSLIAAVASVAVAILGAKGVLAMESIAYGSCFAIAGLFLINAIALCCICEPRLPHRRDSI